MIAKIITCILQLKLFQLFVIRIFSYMERIVSEVSFIWTEYRSLSIYEKIRIEFCSHTGKYWWEKARILVQCYAEVFLTRLSTKTSLCLKIARYKEVSAITKVHYREMLPSDEFIVQQFSINRTCVRYFDRN